MIPSLRIAWLVAVVIAFVFCALLKWGKNIRDLIGIRKDILETRKTSIELQRLDSSIVPATDNDVRKYDPRFKRLEEKLRERARPDLAGGSGPPIVALFKFLILLAVVVGVGILAFRLLVK